MKEDCFRNVHAFEDSSHLGCDTLLFFDVLKWCSLHSCSATSPPFAVLLGHFNSWDEGIMSLQSVWKFSPFDTASYCRRLEFSCVQQSDMMDYCFVPSSWLMFCLRGHEDNEGISLCTVNVQNANTYRAFHVKAVELVTSDSGALWTYLTSCHAFTPLI